MASGDANRVCDGLFVCLGATMRKETGCLHTVPGMGPCGKCASSGQYNGPAFDFGKRDELIHQKGEYADEIDRLRAELSKMREALRCAHNESRPQDWSGLTQKMVSDALARLSTEEEKPCRDSDHPSAACCPDFFKPKRVRKVK